ncbi:hypothetical protein BH11BAC3_BH11BAC3_09300 [soil metagenome]
MAINLLKTIQENLHYPPLQKIDPNTEVVDASSQSNEHRFSQAAIPTVLTGLYTYSSNDESAEKILKGEINSDWITEIFGSVKYKVVDNICTYSFEQDKELVTGQMNAIAAEAVKLIKNEVSPDGTAMDVKKLMSVQTTQLLGYLPTELNMGQLLKEETLDDNTNKMEGPISSLMNKIGSAFSNPSGDS